MATFDALARPFARSIHAKCAALREEELYTDRQRRQRLRESIGDDIRKFTDIVTPTVIPARISAAASAEAQVRNISDICQRGWHDQPGFDAGREVFHLEHFVPVDVVRARCMECSSEAEILQTLQSNVRVVWILKSEDQRLTDLGYRVARDDPERAYADADIVLLPEKPRIVRS